MSKKRFEFWYDEIYTYKGWIEADSEEEAMTMIARVEDGELEIDSLPAFVNKDKGYTLVVGSLAEDVSE